jgi:O-methyltransferase
LDISTAKGHILFGARKIVRPIRKSMNFPTYSTEVAQRIEHMSDDVRYAFLALAIERLEREKIEGAVAELGVWRGQTSKFIHQQVPARRLYLFDTFEGFPAEIAEPGDDRFSDTSQEQVARYIGDLQNILFRVGFFPKTAEGLEDERFALVMIDCDLYQTALDGLQFFYPLMAPGGYIFLHDFNSPESDYGISRATAEFLADKPEKVIEIPDYYGSAVFRKAGDVGLTIAL